MKTKLNTMPLHKFEKVVLNSKPGKGKKKLKKLSIETIEVTAEQVLLVNYLKNPEFLTYLNMK